MKINRTLQAALTTLMSVHTRDSDQVEFTVLMSATPQSVAPWISRKAYIEAWGVLRRYVKTAPEGQKQKQ